MFGTITLKGVQNRNKFVDETGREFYIINSWIDANTKVELFVLLRKFNETSWWVLRSVEISRTHLSKDV